jgi:CRISPR-associated protein Cmr3
MATQLLRINPFDTFFFRDGKPFSMNDDTWADGVFPPSPSVIYGALRTAWIAQQKDGFTTENIQKSEALKIKGIFLEFNNDTIAIPVPRDFVYDKNVKKIKYFLKLEKNKVLGKSFLEMVALPPKDVLIENFDKGQVLEKDVIERYLLKQTNITPKEGCIVQESKIGISRNAETHTTNEGALYRVDMLRFKASYLNENQGNDKMAAIVVEYEGLSLLEKSITKIGGEGKAAFYEPIYEATHCLVAAPNALSDNRFRLCLITPSIFDNGWLPNWINPNDFTGEYKGLKLKLLATVLGKPLSVGGFGFSLQSKKFEPKKMYKAIPAGSVYYFEILQGTLAAITAAFHYQSISEQKANEGFGITYLGV